MGNLTLIFEQLDLLIRFIIRLEIMLRRSHIVLKKIKLNFSNPELLEDGLEIEK